MGMRNFKTVVRRGTLLILLWGLLLPLGAAAQTSDSESATFDATLDAVVRIDLFATPGNVTITDADLVDRYFTLGDLVFDIYAISNYRVTATKTTTGTPPIDTATILEAQILEPGGFAPFEDGEDSLIESFTDLPEGPATIDWMTGGNTQPGTDNKVRVTADLRLDLAALGDNISGNIYTFQITLTVTEE
jgi:hypothetical protein